MINEQSLVLIGRKIPADMMTGKDAALLHTGNQKHKNQNQGYASTLKECIKTDNRLQYMDKKVRFTRISETITDTSLTLNSPAMIL